VGRYDTIIVGAGYSGMAAAAQMPGRRLLVLERHDSVVSKHRGSLGFLLPLGEKVDVRGEDLFLRGLDLLVEGGVRQKFARIRIRGFKERLDIRLRKPLILLNESRLKGALLRRIRENGAEVVVGSAVRDVDTSGKEAKVRTDTEHTARILIGADGVGSVVARSLRFKREKLAILFQREVEIKRLEVPRETLFLQIDDARNLFFAFPFGDRYLASVIQIIGPREVPEDLETRLTDKVERLGADRVLNARGAVVRLYSPSSMSHRSNIVLTGDALASYGFSTIGGALAMGTLAGKSANRFLAGSRYALPDYHDNWRKVSSQRAIERMRLVAPFLGRITTDRVDKVLKAAAGSGKAQSIGPGFLRRLPAVLVSLFV